jgi:hypothetical protein
MGVLPPVWTPDVSRETPGRETLRRSGRRKVAARGEPVVRRRAPTYTRCRLYCRPCHIDVDSPSGRNFLDCSSSSGSWSDTSHRSATGAVRRSARVHASHETVPISRSARCVHRARLKVLATSWQGTSRRGTHHPAWLFRTNESQTKVTDSQRLPIYRLQSAITRAARLGERAPNTNSNRRAAPPNRGGRCLRFPQALKPVIPALHGSTAAVRVAPHTPRRWPARPSRQRRRPIRDRPLRATVISS